MSSPPPVPAAAEPTVYVIDDDESIRELLSWLMKRNAIRAEAFPNARSFLKAYRPGAPGCLQHGLELRLDQGPMTPEAAEAALLAWWSTR